jgi:hypothetical protein
LTLTGHELGLRHLFHPGFPKNDHDAGGLQVLLGLELLPEIDFEGLVHSQAQSERAVLPLGELQSVLEPPARLALEETSHLAGRQHRRRIGLGGQGAIRCGQFRERHFWRYDQFGERTLGRWGKDRQVLQGRKGQLHQMSGRQAGSQFWPHVNFAPAWPG